MSPESRSELGTGVRVAAAVLVAGLPMGVVWWLLAPLPRLVVRRDGVFLASESESAVAADGWFAVCAATGGLVAAVAVFALIRRARVGALLGLTVGGVLASLLAWRLGVLLGPESAADAARNLALGSRFDGPLRVSARGVLLVWPLVSVVAYFALTAGLEPPTRRTVPPPGAPSVTGDARPGRRFPTTVLRPGYAIEDVDDLLSRVEGGRAGPQDIRAAQLHGTRLRRGYEGSAVDAALDELADGLTRRDPVDG